MSSHNKYDWMHETHDDGTEILRHARQMGADRRKGPEVGFADNHLTELAAHQLPLTIKDVADGK